jgi:xanthine dehydrogenase accessory factor
MRILRWAVQTPARYIGMIGSRRKAITVFRELMAEGLRPGLFDRVYSPVGLDIGAITPEEIAVSIVAELIGIRRHAERALPHMSWQLRGRRGADPGADLNAESPHLDPAPTTNIEI